MHFPPYLRVSSLQSSKVGFCHLGQPIRFQTFVDDGWGPVNVADTWNQRSQGRRPTLTIESPYMAIEPTRPPPRRRSRNDKGGRLSRIGRSMRGLSALMTLAFLLLVCVTALLVWFERSSSGPGPLASEQEFIVRPGDGPRTIAARLHEAGMISSEKVFYARYLGRATLTRFETGKPMFLKHGRYEISARASIDSIITVLETGRSVPSYLTFPEGWTTNAIVARLMADDRLEGEITQNPAEGVLLPATFDIRKGMNRQDVLTRMNLAQQSLMAELWPKRKPDLPLQSPHEAIILASIVQREMGPNDDPKRVAAVFINRLRKNMRLESDPTILYGLHGRDVDWSTPIYRSQIRKPTAHNTYTIDGLPPTPICNPGQEAIEAVLNPADTEDLFFVADGKGGHFFAKTLEEHNENVARWRAIEKEIITRRKAREAEEAAAAERSVADTTRVPGLGVINASGIATPASTASVPLPERKPNP